MLTGSPTCSWSWSSSICNTVCAYAEKSPVLRWARIADRLNLLLLADGESNPALVSNGPVEANRLDGSGGIVAPGSFFFLNFFTLGTLKCFLGDGTGLAISLSLDIFTLTTPEEDAVTPSSDARRRRSGETAGGEVTLLCGDLLLLSKALPSSSEGDRVAGGASCCVTESVFCGASSDFRRRARTPSLSCEALAVGLVVGVVPLVMVSPPPGGGEPRSNDESDFIASDRSTNKRRLRSARKVAGDTAGEEEGSSLLLFAVGRGDRIALLIRGDVLPGEGDASDSGGFSVGDNGKGGEGDKARKGGSIPANPGSGITMLFR